MSVRVGSARHDENGNLRGGKAGDQTGQEVMIEPWYLHSKGWVVIRAVSDVIRERIAQDMEYACANNHIGYDQSTSWDLYDKSKAYDWDCSKVTVDTETDCSSLVRVCVAYATCGSIPWFSTLNEVAVLRNTGFFEVLTASEYTNQDTYLKRGDILCTKTQGHTVVVIDNGSGVSGSGNTSLCGTGKGTATAKTAMNIREAASTSAKIIATVAAGTKVEVLKAEGTWYKIVWPGAACGYAYTARGESYYSYEGASLDVIIEVGDTVTFSGYSQYVSAYSTKAVSARPCSAKVTQYEAGGKHKYHVIGSSVYGWVDKDMLSK